MLILIIAIFTIGYVCIAFEHSLKINKAATALVTGVACWMAYILSAGNKQEVIESLAHHLAGVSEILFFLLGAMTIVELIDAHDGFEIITKRISTKNKKKLIWIIAFLAFFLSAALDNLTTAIVMISLVRKLMAGKKDRLLFAGIVVISCNAGGAWSPIGDVTTTMLWIGGQITAANIIVKLFLPSLVAMMVPLVFMQFLVKGNVEVPPAKGNTLAPDERHRNIVFFSGIAILLMIPFFKSFTQLPPYMGILLGLGILWIIVELLNSDKDEEDRQPYTVAYALRKIDTSSILFFLGILLAVSALESTGQLQQLAQQMNNTFKNQNVVVLLIGLASSVVDNVPLVAASTGMYSLQQYPTDHYFWEFLAYCTGTGGSILIIGSAAGVAVMGIEKIDFVWYLKKIGWLALIGYLSGALVYMLMWGWG